MTASPVHNRVALVTGASSGIGEATARALGAAGARVCITARRTDRLERVRDGLAAAGTEVIAVPADVTDRQAVRTVAARTVERFGRIDVLVNNAGIMPLAPVRQLREDDWERMIDVNVMGVLHAVAAVLPGMLQRRDGHIVNVGSVAGRRPLPGGTVYAATKYAVRAISAGLRLELSPEDGIRVTDIEPGVVATELTDHIPDDSIRERFRTAWAAKRPLQADDIARAVVYAVSQPSHVNVNELLVRPTDQAT